MAHSYVVTTTGNLRHTMKKFKMTINPNLQEALNNITKYARYYSMISAPVYNPAKYPTFVGFAHHHTPPPGTLKQSIKQYKTKRAYGIGHRNRAVGVSIFASSFGSKRKYASYVENGFTHHLSGKWIRGRRFMHAGARLAVSRHHRQEVEKAVRKSFGRTH